MSVQRNGSNGVRDSEDQAAREPLIAPENTEASRKKEEFLRRKLHTYEVLIALKRGYMPDTQQIAAWARYILRSSALDARNRRLSPKGREFVRHLRAWIEALTDLLMSKNYDDKIQEFIYHTSHANLLRNVPDVGGAARAGTAGSGQDARILLKKLRRSAALLWSSDEFRGVVHDIVVVGRDMFADAASQVAATAAEAAAKAKSTEIDVQNISSAADSKGVKEKGIAVAESSRKVVSKFRDDLEAYLHEKFPKQRRDAVVNRLKKVIQDIQQNPDFQETVDFIVDMFHKYSTRVKESLEGGKTAEAQPNDNFDIAVKDLQAILMAFAGGRPLDPVMAAFHKVIDDIQSDKDLKDFYEDVAHEFNRLLTEKGYVTSDAADAEAHKLYERSQLLLEIKSDRYRPDVENLFHQVRSFIEAIRNDRETQRLVEASKKVYNDLVITDKTGHFRGFRKRVLWDLIEVIIPRFVDDIKYIPIPRIEYQDPDYDLILENVVLESEHFLPTRTIFEAFTRLEITNHYTISSSHTTTTHLHISNINLFCRDTSFVIRKKTGMLKFSDRGYIDVFMTGKGASADLVLESAAPDDDEDDPTRDSFFHVKSVDVKIHNLSYNYHAYHSWAATLGAPIIKPIVRRLLSKVLEERIKGCFEQLDREIYAAAERMRVASIATRGGGSLEGWIRAVLSRPEGKRTKQRGEWRISVEDDGGLIFPGEHAPGGILTKMWNVEERVEAGKEPGGWRNVVFDIRG